MRDNRRERLRRKKDRDSHDIKFRPYYDRLVYVLGTVILLLFLFFLLIVSLGYCIGVFSGAF